MKTYHCLVFFFFVSLRVRPKCSVVWLHFATQRPIRDQEGSCWDRRSEQAQEMVALLGVLLSTQFLSQALTSLLAVSLFMPFFPSQFRCVWRRFVKSMLTQHVHRCKTLRKLLDPRLELTVTLRSWSSHFAWFQQGQTLTRRGRCTPVKSFLMQAPELSLVSDQAVLYTYCTVKS